MTCRRRPDEAGTALVELAIFMPLLLILASLGAFGGRVLTGYAKVNDVSASAARYATRAAMDPERAQYRTRPTASEVETYVRRISTVPVDSVTVTPDPSTATPGTNVTVVIRTHVSLGTAGSAVNTLTGAFAGLLGGHAPWPSQGIAITSTTVMREE